jgi:hypothetical protein
VDQNKAELADQGCAPVIAPLDGYIRDVTDTLSILRDLDLVITCESAMGHIAAFANKECWIPYSYMGRDYRIGVDGTDQIWSNHKVFCQDSSMQWEPVFASMVEELQRRML